MKSLEKVITDRIKRIECNNLTTINYIDHKNLLSKNLEIDHSQVLKMSNLNSI